MIRYFLLFICNFTFSFVSHHNINGLELQPLNGPLLVVNGNLVPIANGNLLASPIDNTLFLSCQIINETSTVTYTIVNDGTTALTISNVVINGIDSSDFQLVNLPNTIVQAGESTMFSVLFNPSSVGLKSAFIEIQSNDLVNPIYSFAIAGTGLDFIECGYNLNEEVIYKQDFEANSTIPVLGYTIANGIASVTGGTAFGVNATPLVLVPKFMGTSSLQVNNSFCTLLFDTINTNSIKDPSFRFKLASFAKTPSEGSENGDYVSLAISSNGGNSWSNEIQVTGSSQAKWSFNSGVGLAESTYSGTDFITAFNPSTGGFLTTEGYSTIILNGLPKTNSLIIRLTIVNNNTNEIWAIDNIELLGKLEASTIWNGTQWSNGIPNEFTKAIIDGDYNTLVNGNIGACKCQVNLNKTLTIGSNSYLLSESDINNYGNLVVEDSGTIIQKDDYASNTGNAVVKRNANIRMLDYVYWSSPIQQFLVNLISPNTPLGYNWKWNPTINNPNGGIGFWTPAAGETMEIGRGYIVRGPSSFGTTPQNFTAIFSGSTINNGLINSTISRGPMTMSTLPNYTSLNGVPFSIYDDNWNLIGNPYPSALNIESFLIYNAVDNPVIEGSVRLWTHGTLPSTTTNPFYNSYLYNYTTNDYITHNGTATLSGPGVFNGFVASCQSFFVLMNEGDQGSSTVTYKNFMRDKSLNSNSQFYKSQLVSLPPEKHRIWLDLVSESGNATRTAVGYLNNATYQKDALYDAFAKLDGSQNLYTLIENDRVCIQGRPLPFQNDDTVLLGYTLPTSGTYTIAIGALDGLFTDNQDIFLEDKLLDVTHNLKQSPYHFYTNAGTFDTRFKVKYQNNALSQSTNPINDHYDLVANPKNNEIIIKSSSIIKSVTIFDILGRTLLTKKNLNQERVEINELTSKKQGLLVSVELDNSTKHTKKILF
jgi:hypothetical protein